jgi:hypothetical protein
VIPSDSEEFSAWSKASQIEVKKTINNTQVVNIKNTKTTLELNLKYSTSIVVLPHWEWIQMWQDSEQTATLYSK